MGEGAIVKTLLKVIGGLIALVVVLVVVAAIAVPMLVDPNTVKEQITTRVREQTGRDLKVSGDIELSVFPWLGVNLGAAELGNAQGFAAPYFARTKRVKIHVKLLPLLERKLEMDTVTIEGLAINLARNAKGRSNWDDLLAAGREGGAAPGAEGGGEGPGLAGLAIGGLDLRDASLTWNDAQTGRQLAVRGLSLSTGAISPAAAVPLKLAFDFSSEAPKLSGHVTLDTTLSVDPGASSLRAQGLQAVADLLGDGLPGGKGKIALSGDLAADGKRRSAIIKGLKLTVLDLNAGGELSVSGGAKGRVQGNIKIAEFSPRTLLAALGQTVPETADPKVLTRAAAEIQLSGTPRRMVLKPFTIRLDDTRLQGSAELLNPAKPAVRFDLAIDALDADRYLPPSKPGEARAVTTPGAATAQAADLPLARLRALDVDGKLRIAKFKVAKLTVTEIAAVLNAKGGVIRLSPVSAKLYQGRYAGNMTLDARKETPRLTVDERLSAVQAGPLLKDLSGRERITGTVDASAKLSARGATAAAAQRTLNGTARFAFRDGALKGVNIARLIREAKAKIQGRSLAPAAGEQQTDFSEVTGSVRIKDGLASNDDFSAKSPLLRINGRGTADLPRSTLDYRVKTTLVATTAGQGGKDLADLAGIPIPLRVTGTFQDPKYGIDIEALTRTLAKSKVKGLIAGQKKKLTGSLVRKLKGSAADGGTGKVKGLLKGILGQ